MLSKKRNLSLLALLALCLCASAQIRPLRLMAWNVENLFDCRHDSLMDDSDFLPEGTLHWTRPRYWAKLADIARVIMAVGGDRPPDLVALEEVENDSCLIDLTRRTALRSLAYRYVMTHGHDRRGIDVALLYQPQSFDLIGCEARRVPSAEAGLPPTRDILHAWGRMPGGDTLHVIVCHLPSRTTGKQGDRNRLLAAQTLASLADSIGADKRIVVAGDFNATPSDRIFSCLSMLAALAPKERWPAEGTYRFRGVWSWIDHILASSPVARLISGLSLYTAPWMQDPDSKGGWHPRRTYTGPAYHGGVSDHVPIYCDILPSP